MLMDAAASVTNHLSSARFFTHDSFTHSYGIENGHWANAPTGMKRVSTNNVGRRPGELVDSYRVLTIHILTSRKVKPIGYNDQC